MAPMQPKRLVIIGPFPPYRGGIAHFTQAMSEGLHARGHDVRAVSFSRQYPSVLFPGTTQFEPGRTSASRTSAEAAPRLISTLNPLSWLRAARHSARQRPDVALVQYWMPFFAPALGVIAWWLRRRGVRVIGVVHNALPHERRPGDRLLSRFFLRACNGLVVLSKAVEDDVRRLGVTAPVRRAEHPVFAHFGEALPKAQARRLLDVPAGAPVLLFFGFIRRYKGLHVLLDAMPEVIERLPDVRLVVAGEFYDDPAPYHAQIRRHGLGDHVLLRPDYIPQDEVARYFSAADVVVQPYLSATQSGIASIAFHFGRPLIVTDVGGLAEVVPHEEAGLVVPPDDASTLAATIVRFFEEDLGEKLTEGVRQARQNHSWDRLYEAVEALLEGGESE